MINTNLKEHRVIFFSDEINMNTMKVLKEEIMEYALDNKQPITIFLDSPGGVIQNVYGLIDVIAICGCPVNLVGNGNIASAASYLLCSGTTKGRRYMTKNSEFMVHQPYFTDLGACNRDELKRKADLLDRNYQHLLNNYLASSTLTKKELEKLFVGEGTVLTAEEALKCGFIDHIVDGLDELL